MDNAILLTVAGQFVAGTALAALVFAGYRSIKRRSRVLGTILALGILGRAILGLTLFTIAYFELPIAETLQMGGGFWTLAADATLYYQYALRVMEQGLLETNYRGYPSPFFLQVLAVWMWLLGVSPAVGMFLNICVYVATCVLIVRMYAPTNNWRHDLPCIVAISAYTFAPIAFIHATQILKDDFFYLLIAVVCVSVLGLSKLLVYGDPRYRLWAILGGATLAATLVGLSSIRWYFPVIVWGALACMCLLFAVRGRVTPLPRYLLGSGVILLIMGVAAGAQFDREALAPLGPGAESFGSSGSSLATVPSALGTLAQSARMRFLQAAGDTNIVVSIRKEPQTTGAPSAGFQGPRTTTGASGVPTAAELQTEQVARATPRGFADHVRVAALGLAVVFVPISLLKAVSLVDFEGGRGLLPVADLDTIVFDAALLFLLIALWQRRHRLGDNLPFVTFVLVLSGVTMVLLGYVVTNYGTLIRMRPMIAVPLWVVVVALSPRGRESLEPSPIKDEKARWLPSSSR